MSVNQSEITKAGETSFGLQRYLIRFVAVVTLLLIIIPLLPGFISNLVYSFSGEAPKIYWYLSRSAGFVAFTILWISMLLGLGITNKLARLWPGAPAAFAVHEFVSLLGLAFVAYHGLVLMGDHFVDFSLPRLLMPFSIEYETFWVGLGQVSFYVWAIVTATFYVRRLIGQRTWRLIHFVNFATYTMGLLHGIFSGTDSSVNWVRGYYLITGGSLLALLAYRVYDSAVRKGFSFSNFVRQRAYALARISTRLKRRLMVAKKKSRLAVFLRRHASLPVPAPHPSTHSQTMSEDTSESSVDEKTQPQVLEIPAIENQAHLLEDSSAAEPAMPVSEVTETPHIPMIKLEKSSSEDRVKVRIFKESTTKPVILETQKDAEIKQVDAETLLVRLKRDFHGTPVQQRSKRIVILEE